MFSNVFLTVEVKLIWIDKLFH